MANFKIIKSKSFTFTQNGETISGTAYTLGFKGRAFNCSSLSFEEGDLIESNGVLEVKPKVELVPESYTNSVGQTVQGFKLMPVMDLNIAQF